MSRHLWWGVIAGLIVTSLALAQGGPADTPVKELFEDDTDFLINNLTNPGAADASVAERSEETFFSGVCSLSVSEFQRFNPQLPGWRFQIAENPRPGQYRYIRFAWKRTEAEGIMLQLPTAASGWKRYYAGTVSERTRAWGEMIRVDDEVPRKWEAVTRDLFQDFGPVTITGIGLSALEGSGLAYFDHIYLGRTVEDLDRVTAQKQGIVEPPPGEDSRANSRSWLIGLVAAGAVAVALFVLLFAWLRRWKQPAPVAAGGSPAIDPEQASRR